MFIATTATTRHPGGQGRQRPRKRTRHPRRGAFCWSVLAGIPAFCGKLLIQDFRRGNDSPVLSHSGYPYHGPAPDFAFIPFLGKHATSFPSFSCPGNSPALSRLGHSPVTPLQSVLLTSASRKTQTASPVGRSSNATRAKLALVTSCSSSSFYPPTPGHIRLLNGAYVPLLAGRSRPERPWEQRR